MAVEQRDLRDDGCEPSTCFYSVLKGSCDAWKGAFASRGVRVVDIGTPQSRQTTRNESGRSHMFSVYTMDNGAHALGSRQKLAPAPVVCRVYDR